jgi:hypothetical protein
VFIDHVHYGFYVLIGNSRILKSEICPQREQHLLRLVVTHVLLNTIDKDVYIPLVIGSSPLEVRFHIVLILLVDPQVDATAALIHLMSNVCEDPILLPLTLQAPFKLRLPDEFKFLLTFPRIFLDLVNS